MSELLENHRILEKAFVKLQNDFDDATEENAHKTKSIEYLETLNEEKSEEIEILESSILNLEHEKEVTHLSLVPETNITPEYASSLQNSICLLKPLHSDSSVQSPYFNFSTSNFYTDLSTTSSNLASTMFNPLSSDLSISFSTGLETTGMNLSQVHFRQQP